MIINKAHTVRIDDTIWASNKHEALNRAKLRLKEINSKYFVVAKVEKTKA